MNDLSHLTPLQRILIGIAVMLPALMQVLDTTIVNVALPYMQGSLGANPDQISWILTSYMVASAIFMPLTGYLNDKLGIRNYLLLSIVCFIINSVLCGLSQNLSQIVFFRLLQGISGAALIPLAQAVLTAIFPKHQRAKAMALWGFVIMIGPISGPTLGAYLVEIANWRWVFFINIPLGIFAYVLASQMISSTLTKERAMDWLGLVFISIFIGSLQYFLDRGSSQDWFNAWNIRFAMLLSVGCLLAFIIHNIFKPKNIVFDLSIFKDRNFTLASLLIGIMDLCMFGVLVLQPLMLENLFNYSILTTGLIMAPRGIAGLLGMIFIGKIGHRFHPKVMIAIACLFSIVSLISYTHLTLDASPISFVWPMLIQGFCVSVIFAATSSIAFSTLAPKFVVEGAGLFSLIRTLSGSLGISITLAIFTQKSQVFWNQLGGFINPYNPAMEHYLANLQNIQNASLAFQVLGLTLKNQVQMLAFTNTFMFIKWCLIIMLVLVFLIRKSDMSVPG